MASSNLTRASILFKNLRQTITNKATKSTFTYDVDKTASQKWIQSRISRLREQQKLYATEDGTPIWWKTKSDKALTTFVFAATIASFVTTLTNLIRYSQGKL